MVAIKNREEHEMQMKACGLCESSCRGDHVYLLKRNVEYFICNRCWMLIRDIVQELLDEQKPKPVVVKHKPEPKVKTKKE